MCLEIIPIPNPSRFSQVSLLLNLRKATSRALRCSRQAARIKLPVFIKKLNNLKKPADWLVSQALNQRLITSQRTF